MKKKFTFVAILLAQMLLLTQIAGCSHYSFSLNENQLYSPPSLYTKFEVADPALKTCITQTIMDNNITQPAQLKKLACTKAGIFTLKGIEIFDKIVELNLNDNKLVDIQNLYQLTDLKLLYLKNNELSNIQSLLTMPALERIQLDGNSKILCSDIEQLKQRKFKELQLPETCRKP